MTISWTGGSGLFTRIGHLANMLYLANNYQGSTIPTQINEIIGDYGTNDQAIIDQINSTETSGQSSVLGLVSAIQSIAKNVVIRMVYLDTGLTNTNLTTALTEVVRQMKANSQLVLQSTTSVSTASTLTNGNGVIAASAKNADGYNLEDAFAESLRVAVSQDSSTNSSIAGNETFTITGNPSPSSILAQDAYNFSSVNPQTNTGSGANTTCQAVNATVDNSQGNLLTNSDFESFTSNTPNNWTVIAGTQTTDFLKSTSTVYSGSSSFEFTTAAPGHAAQLAQPFNSTSGTSATLSANTVYALNVFARITGSWSLSNGFVNFELIDGNNSTINNNFGTVNRITLTASTLTTGWTNVSGFFQTPTIMPSTIQLSIRCSGSFDQPVFLDNLSMTKATQAYQGGPYIAVFGGSSNFYKPDFFTVTATNTRPATLKTFQTVFDRFFNMRGLNLLLPSTTATGSVTISDSLIT